MGSGNQEKTPSDREDAATSPGSPGEAMGRGGWPDGGFLSSFGVLVVYPEGAEDDSVGAPGRV